MFLSRLFALLRKTPGDSREGQWAGLHPPEQFGKVLERERARSDRTGEGFSLLVFSPRKGEPGPVSLRPLAEVVRRRLRSTDDAGWLRKHRIGVLLPATPAEGAWALADRICLGLGEQAAPPVCEVYRYPSPDFPLGRPRRAAKPAPGYVQETQPMEVLFMRHLPAWKRGLDILGATAGLVLLTPVFAAAALAVKFSSPGPVLFRQYRSGLGGKPFLMYKFRSMVADAEEKKRELLDRNEQDGPAFKVEDDPRITPVGRFLRSTAIDELPQLWNVLKGEMSLVGPRPLPCDETAAACPWHRRRLDVTPGLTCTWQARRGCRVSFAEWMRMDLRYVRAMSLWRDVKLMFGTVPKVVLRRGC